ncbi:helix-turn-helix domain-containing protein [Pseudonocardia ailaonensis]|uniref:Helix-turn-helix domain-containing protein n=1 Tax=Pseudonocardia ailaonensis TaxID=367279 RepID=A0ABN2N059_9PSEU
MIEADDGDGLRYLCDRILAELPTSAVAITENVREAFPDYTLVSKEEHYQHVLEQEIRLVTSIKESRAPNEEDLKRAAALGRLRARQGVSVASAIGAHQACYQELWKIMQSTSSDQGVLARAATAMWSTMLEITTEVAAAHTSTRSLQANEITLRHRLIELLGDRPEDDETEAVAKGLRFDPRGRFVAAVVRGGAVRTDDVGELQRRFSRFMSPAIAVRRGLEVVLVCQGTDAVRVAAALREEWPQAHAGVGLARMGLAGAATSIDDADLALALVDREHPVQQFEAVWLQAALLAQAARLGPLVGDLVDVVGQQASLVDALAAYRDHGFSIVDAARQLQIHPNTVTYRLHRWEHLTGMDPRTYEGMNRSVLAWLLTRSRGAEAGPAD